AAPAWDRGSPGNASFVGQENGREEAETTAEPLARPMCFTILAATGDTEQRILERTGSAVGLSKFCFTPGGQPRRARTQPARPPPEPAASVQPRRYSAPSFAS